MLTSRYFGAGDSKTQSGKSWRSPFGGRQPSKGHTVCQSKTISNSPKITSPFLERAGDLIATALAPKTIQAYSSIINSYRDYMRLHGENDCNPSEEMVCRWVGYESLFIDPASGEICTSDCILLGYIWEERGD